MDEITAAQAARPSGSRVFSGAVHIETPAAFGRALLHDDVDIAVLFGALENTSHLVVRHLVTQARVTCTAPAYLMAPTSTTQFTGTLRL